VDTENTQGMSPDDLLEIFSDIRISKKCAISSRNTPLTVIERWRKSEFQLNMVEGKYKNAVDLQLCKLVLAQVSVDERLGHPPGNFIFGVTGDSDYCDLIHILSRLGHRISIIGWGEANPKLKQLAHNCFNLKAIDGIQTSLE
jgi:hypothetical protein